MITMLSGETFVYDQEQDAISLLDTRTGVGNVAACRTYKGARMAIFLDTTPKIVRASAWKDDWASTTSGATVYLPAWDFDLPEHEKLLLGYHVTFKPIAGAETITVSWQLDESGSYTDATVINSGTTGASTGRAFIPVSDATNSRKFRQLRTKVVLTGGTELYAVTARAEVADYFEEWNYAFRISEPGTAPAPSSKNLSAAAKLDLFFNSSTGLLPTKKVVTLVDGTVSPVPGVSTSSTVRVSDARFLLKRLGPNYLEGTLFASFRSATP